MDIAEMLSYGFMQRALIGGSLIAILCSVLGVFLVLRRLSLIGDGLSHVTFGSVALAMFFRLHSFYMTLAIIPVVLACAMAGLLCRLLSFASRTIAAGSTAIADRGT